MKARRRTEEESSPTKGETVVPKMLLGHAFPTWGENGMEFHSEFWSEDRFNAYVLWLSSCRTILAKMDQSDPGAWKSVLRLCGDSWKKEKNLGQKAATIEWVVNRPVVLMGLVKSLALPEFKYTEPCLEGADRRAEG